MRRRFIAAGAMLLMICGPSFAQTPTPAVVGTANEPAFFDVTGVADSDLLNVRATATAGGMMIARIPNGTRLKNLGCREVSKYRWCKVQDIGDPKMVGWVPGRYLQDVAGADAEAAAAGGTAIAATAQVPCARYFGQPMALCQASAVRSEDGEAAVTVNWPDGGERTIRFGKGKPQSADSPDPLKFTREADLNMIRIGKGERFEIPDKLPFGG